jgi:hypothetical protein
MPRLVRADAPPLRSGRRVAEPRPAQPRLQQVSARPVVLRGPRQHQEPPAVPLRLDRRETVDLLLAAVQELLEGRAELPQRLPPRAHRDEPAVLGCAKQILAATREVAGVDYQGAGSLRERDLRQRPP